MGRLTVKSWSLGEVAILFSMTRPTYLAERVPFKGRTPPIVWLLLAAYAGTGLFAIGFEIRCYRRLIRRHKEANVSSNTRLRPTKDRCDADST
jgi:hypothetical protein